MIRLSCKPSQYSHNSAASSLLADLFTTLSTQTPPFLLGLLPPNIPDLTAAEQELEVMELEIQYVSKL